MACVFDLFHSLSAFSSCEYLTASLTPLPSEALLTAPTAGDEKRIDRLTASYVPRYQRFILRPKEFFSHQFAPLYAQRLEGMAHMARTAAESKWGDAVPMRNKILELREGEDCVIVGTLFKDMPLKPSILDEYARDRGISPAILGRRATFVSSEDTLLLEDNTGRLRLMASQAQVAALVTGLVAAVRGCELSSGDFRIDDLAFPLASLPPPRTVSPKHRYVAIMSGLNLGSSTPTSPLAMQMLISFITGSLGSLVDEEEESQVVRLIIAGNVLGEGTLAALSAPSTVEFKLKAKAGMGDASRHLDPVKEADILLRQLCSSVAVDVMPGDADPSNFALPQQPLSHCLFPLASALQSLALTSNPYEASVDNTIILGTSGQPLADLKRCVAEPNDLDLLESTLRWSHLCPTAPDTLGCYPFYDRDPFAITALPHVYFSGNSPAFATRVAKFGANESPVRLVCVPSFAQSGDIALVDLADLSARVVRFAGPMQE